VRPRRTNASAVADEGHAEMLGVEVLASEAGLHPLSIGCRVLDLLEVDDREVAHLSSCDFELVGSHAAFGVDASRDGASWSGSGMRSPSRSRTTPASSAASAPPHQMLSGLVCRRTPPIAGPRAREPVNV